MLEHLAYDPEYRVVKGWKKPTAGITGYEALPQAARDYVRIIEDELEVKVSIISTGPRREETVLRRP